MLVEYFGHERLRSELGEPRLRPNVSLGELHDAPADAVRDRLVRVRVFQLVLEVLEYTRIQKLLRDSGLGPGEVNQRPQRRETRPLQGNHARRGEQKLEHDDSRGPVGHDVQVREHPLRRGRVHQHANELKRGVRLIQRLIRHPPAQRLGRLLQAAHLGDEVRPVAAAVGQADEPVEAPQPVPPLEMW